MWGFLLDLVKHWMVKSNGVREMDLVTVKGGLIKTYLFRISLVLCLGFLLLGAGRVLSHECLMNDINRPENLF